MYRYPMEKAEIAERYVYSHGYVFYDRIKIGGIPKEILVEGIKLKLKDKFHITLIWTEKIANIIDQDNQGQKEKEVLDTVIEFLKTSAPRDFELTGQFRMCQENEETTVIAMCNLFGAEELFDQLKQKYNVNIPTQPFHITLYYKNTGGIGILSKDHLEKVSEIVELPELKKIKATKPV